MTIDNVNISQFTANMLQHSYLGLLAYPPLKTPLTNDWSEYDGLEVDLLYPKLNKKDLEMEFLLFDKSKYADFVDFLTATTYRIWHFPELGKSFRLRVVSFSNYKEFQERGELKVKLSDDFPMQGYSYSTPNGMLGEIDWKLDGKAFSDYGIYTLMGSEEIHKVEEMKPILEITNSQMEGVQVAVQPLKKKSRKATIKCFLRCHSADFWRNYYAFLHDWTQSGVRNFSVDDKNYSCYYENCKVIDFYRDMDIIRCSFDLSIVLI